MKQVPHNLLNPDFKGFTGYVAIFLIIGFSSLYNSDAGITANESHRMAAQGFGTLPAAVQWLAFYNLSKIQFFYAPIIIS